MDEIELSQNKKSPKIRVVLISGLKYHLSGIACFPTWPLPTWPHFAKSSTMHSDLKLNRKRNFRFIRFLSLFPIFCSDFFVQITLMNSHDIQLNYHHEHPKQVYFYILETQRIFRPKCSCVRHRCKKL